MLVLQSKSHFHGLDDDAVLYARRVFFGSGKVIQRHELQDISEFIKGLKQLNLWPFLTEAWLLRSGQNAGTGITVYGLKGVSNGTLINGLTWGSSGIQGTLQSQSISTTLNPNNVTELSAYFAVKEPTTSSNRVSFSLTNFVTTHFGLSVRQPNSNAAASARRTIADTNVSIFPDSGTSLTAYCWAMNCTNYANGTIYGNLNGSTATGVLASSGNLIAPTNATFNIMSNGDGGNYNKEASVAIVFTKDVRNFASAIHNLYKNTLGKGLGLP